jgi:DNA-binding response OmpR family regulator/DNA-binding CsgD family transcriptional regulator
MVDKERTREIVLVVDDSPETLGFLTDAMEAAGVTVLVARSGETGLNIARQVVPDIILMDAVMPGLDGFETCKRMKKMAEVAHVPIIFMTGLTETEHVVHALESGGVDYLTKPINIDELRARIRVHLANARSAQSARIALDAAGRHLMAVSANGEVLWTTPQASRLLDAMGPGGAGSRHVAARASGWIGETTAPEGRVGESFGVDSTVARGLQLLYLGVVGNDEHLFRLVASGGENQDNHLRQMFGLTQRESEVLLWIARGKSNRDIGDILGLSPRTVNKHLEQVYAKLGVENRASAAIKATHALQPLEQ